MKRKVPLMIIVILLLQIILPMVGVIWENDFTIKSIAADTLEATDSNGITWTYELRDGNATNVKPKDKSTLPNELTMPSTLDGYTVTSIKSEAFINSNKLENINIPNNITVIGSNAFANCNNLININVEKYNPNYSSEDGILFNKEKTELIRYPGGKKDTIYEIPSSVSKIGTGAFHGSKNLSSIEIQDGLTKIDHWAFSYCYFTKIIIPKTVTHIVSDAFMYCDKLTTIEVDDDNENYSSENGVLFNKDKTYLMEYPEGKKELQYEIPSTVTTIGSYAFYKNKNIEKIKIPSSVMEVWIPSSINCDNLINIDVDKNNQHYSSENGVLFNKDKTELLCYPAGKEGTEYTIPNSVTSIESDAFYNCKNLINIEIPDGVTYINGGTFANCSSLTNIKIPNSVTSIGKYAFFGCARLTSIKIPSSVINIEEDAFDSSLKTIICNDNSKAKEYAIDNKIQYNFIGDINGDETIDFMDILAINKHRLGKAQLTGVYLEVADVNGDGDIDFMDILQINKYRLGKIDSL